MEGGRHGGMLLVRVGRRRRWWRWLFVVLALSVLLFLLRMLFTGRVFSRVIMLVLLSIARNDRKVVSKVLV